jgi:hypothetical protein
MKFINGALVRPTADGLIASRAGRDLGSVMALADSYGLRFFAGINLPESKLDALVARARLRTGDPQPDLASIVRVDVPSRQCPSVAEIMEGLRGCADVEWVWMLDTQYTCTGDIAPYTPDISFLQTYKDSLPGMGFVAAWEHGLVGSGVRVSDVEFGWNGDHEDLEEIDLHLEPGQTIHPDVAQLGFDDHGTAVAGMLVAGSNGFGCTGMASAVSIYTYPVLTVEEGERAFEALTAAAADSVSGDVILIEISPSASGAPLETELPMWTIIKLATDAGVVVVEGAGNGGKNLDNPAWTNYMSWGDSGAILVGAGTADNAHDKLSFSCFGSRVDVQGWGEGVFTLGYGDFAAFGGDENQSYSGSFGGTSSASAMVAAAVIALQQRAVDLYLTPLASSEMRDLLISTGVPQGTGGHIGPFVQVDAALAALHETWADLGYGLSGGAGMPMLVGQGKLEPVAPVAFTLSRVRPGAPCWLVLGASVQSKSFMGGTLVPTVDSVVGPFFTDGSGELTLSDTMPSAVMPGQHVYGQFWIADSASPSGAAASNAIVGVVP